MKSWGLIVMNDWRVLRLQPEHVNVVTWTVGLMLGSISVWTAPPHAGQARLFRFV
jgi:hypothetical protein